MYTGRSSLWWPLCCPVPPCLLGSDGFANLPRAIGATQTCWNKILELVIPRLPVLAGCPKSSPVFTAPRVTLQGTQNCLASSADSITLPRPSPRSPFPWLCLFFPETSVPSSFHCGHSVSSLPPVQTRLCVSLYIFLKASYVQPPPFHPRGPAHPPTPRLSNRDFDSGQLLPCIFQTLSLLPLGFHPGTEFVNFPQPALFPVPHSPTPAWGLA